MLRIERIAQASRWRRRHPGEKAALALGLLVLALVLDPWPGAALVLAFSSGLAVIASGTRAHDYAALLAPPAAFLLAGAAAMLVSFDPGAWPPRLAFAPENLPLAIGSAARALAATGALLLLIVSTPLNDALGLVRRCGVPAPIVDVMRLSHRFVALVIEIAQAGRSAQASRLGYAGVRRGVRASGMLIAALLPRCLDRAERMEAGLRARGYDGGALATLTRWPPLSPRFLTASAALLVAILSLSTAIAG